MSKKCVFLTFLFIVFSFVKLSYSQADSFQLFFQIDERSLNPVHKNTLDTISLENADTVFVTGYADHLGTSAYNRVLAADRAENVKEYLSKAGNNSVVVAVGKGATGIVQDLDPAIGHPSSRRVDIVIMRRSPPPEDVVEMEDPEDVHDLDFVKDIEKGQNIVWENLNFQPGRHVLLPEAVPSLERLLAMLKKHPGIKIQIEGHICCRLDGSDGLDIDTRTYNLSVNRARIIYNYLIDHGIDKDRLSYVGYGRSRPLIPYERTDEDRIANRRVEIRIVEME